MNVLPMTHYNHNGGYHHHDPLPLKVTLQSCLPTGLHLQILNHVSQYDLCNVSLLNHYWYELATVKLYYHILILANSRIPKFHYTSKHDYISKAHRNFASGTIIMETERIDKLVETLKNNPRLIHMVRMFGLHHWIDTEFEIDRVKFELFELISSSCNLKTFGGMFKFDDNDFVKFFAKTSIRERLTTLYITDLNQLFVPNFPKNLTNLNMELNNLDNLSMELDLASPIWSFFYQIKELNINTKYDLGFLILKNMKLNPILGKLKLKSLSLVHLHSTKLLLDIRMLTPVPQVLLDIRDDHFLNELSFKLLDSVVDVKSLINFNLKVDCHVDHFHQFGDDSTCFKMFFKDLNETYQTTLPMNCLILETFENNFMLGPRTFVSNYLDPILNFIIKCDSLYSLTLNFDNPGLQFYEEVYSDDILKVINEAIFHFLKILKYPLKNLKNLVLPEFVLSFIYFSRNTFLHGFLKNCECDGCIKTLANLKKNFIDASKAAEIQDQQLIDLFANILLMLQFKRELYKPTRFSTEFNKFPIFTDCRDTLHGFYHENKLATLLNSDLVNDGAENSANVGNDFGGDAFQMFDRLDIQDEGYHGVGVNPVIEREAIDNINGDGGDGHLDDILEDRLREEDARNGHIPATDFDLERDYERVLDQQIEVIDRLLQERESQQGEKNKKFNCECEIGKQDIYVATLVSHQIRPYLLKFLDIFPKVEYISLSGIYFEILPIDYTMLSDRDRIRCLYDDLEYPEDYV